MSSAGTSLEIGTLELTRSGAVPAPVGCRVDPPPSASVFRRHVAVTTGAQRGRARPSAAVTRRWRPIWWVTRCLSLVVAWWQVFAGSPWAGEYPQNQAMGGAAVAVVADPSAVAANPAGMAQVRRYNVNGMFSHADSHWNLGASVVDSASAPLAMGLDYRLRKPTGDHAVPLGYKKRQELNVALAEFYEQKVGIGIGYRFMWTSLPSTAETEKQHDLSAGIIVPVHEMLRFGLTGHDVVPIGNKPRRDPRIGFGAGFSPHEMVVFVLDGIWHYDDPERVYDLTLDRFKEWEIVPGMELIALKAVAMRGGWRKNLYTGARSIHAGLGWFFPRGQIAYAFTVQADDTFLHTVSLEINAF